MRARVVTVSATYGAGGALVAPLLAERLGVPFADRLIDRYPPDLQTLVDGVDVVSRQASAANQFGSVNTDNGGATANSGGLLPKKKIYLREIPVDPITGEKDWCILSSLEPADQGCSASPPNVFDVRSKARGEALNGEKYSDW